MLLKIVTRDNCIWCERVQELLADHNYTFEVWKPPLKILKEWLKARGLTTVPQVLNDERLVGGFEVVKALIEKGELT